MASPYEFLQQLRAWELEVVVPWLVAPNAGRRLLEFGAGSGWQAKALSDRGFAVAAVDLDDTQYASARVFPVTSYDGRTLPFADASFDLVFSSNVLEHVVDEEQIQRELWRVLAPGGRAVHLMPTPTWRLATTLGHYPFLARLAWTRVVGRGQPVGHPHLDGAFERARTRNLGATMRRVVGALRHGERGNVFSETWLFGRRRWLNLFARHDWRVHHAGPTGIFYTGYSLCGDHLHLEARKRLAGWVGSGCAVYVLDKPADASRPSRNDR